MLQAFFHAWERRLASVTTDRVVRPFNWGLDWIPPNGHPTGTAPARVLDDWVAQVMADTDAFFTPPPTNAYEFASAGDGTGRLEFPSALVTPHPVNNTVRCRFFRARSPQSRAAVPGACVRALGVWRRPQRPARR